MRIRPNVYSPEFKSDALELIRRGDRSYRQLSADLGVNSWTLRGWYKADVAKKKKATTTASATETIEEKLARLERENGLLRKENESLKVDREILKKAAAFFAKERE